MGNTSWRARARLRHARTRSAKAVAAAVGLALAVPVLTTAPAQAGLLDIPGEVPIVGDLTDLVAPTPVIAPGEAGQIQMLGQVCTSDGTVQKVCDQLTLAGLDPTTVTSLLLTAVPADPGDVPEWGASCPAPLGAVCTIPLSDLLGATPLAPVVTFLPGSAGAVGPDTRITSAAPGKQKTTHTFTFEGLREDGTKSDTSTFECMLEFTPQGTPPSGAQKSHPWDECGVDPVGGQTYPNLANGDYVFGVRAVEPAAAEGGEALVDETPATQSWTVATAPEVPETAIVAGPRAGSWVFTRQATFRFESTVEGGGFQCWYDNLTNACDSGAFTWASSLLKPGTHVFKVAASANQTRDFSPAGRSFHVPFDDRALAGAGWTRTKAKKHFKNTVTTTTTMGAALTTRQTLKFRRVALVADKGRGYGTVKVFWGGKMLREVSLHAKRLQTRKVIPIKRFTGKLRSGRLRIVVVSSGRTVRIDGIGVARR
jgi:hypothetical protein